MDSQINQFNLFKYKLNTLYNIKKQDTTSYNLFGSKFKKSIILLVLLMICNMASSCPPPEIAADANIDLYKAAYNYIVKVGTKKEKDYVISYMTYDLDRHGFQDKLVDMPEEKKLVEEFNKRHYFYLEED